MLSDTEKQILIARILDGDTNAETSLGDNFAETDAAFFRELKLASDQHETLAKAGMLLRSHPGFVLDQERLAVIRLQLRPRKWLRVFLHPLGSALSGSFATLLVLAAVFAHRDKEDSDTVKLTNFVVTGANIPEMLAGSFRAEVDILHRRLNIAARKLPPSKQLEIELLIKEATDLSIDISNPSRGTPLTVEEEDLHKATYLRIVNALNALEGINTEPANSNT